MSGSVSWNLQNTTTTPNAERFSSPNTSLNGDANIQLRHLTEMDVNSKFINSKFKIGGKP